MEAVLPGGGGGGGGAGGHRLRDIPVLIHLLHVDMRMLQMMELRLMMSVKVIMMLCELLMVKSLMVLPMPTSSSSMLKASRPLVMPSRSSCGRWVGLAWKRAVSGQFVVVNKKTPSTKKEKINKTQKRFEPILRYFYFLC